MRTYICKSDVIFIAFSNGTFLATIKELIAIAQPLKRK